jgi:plastocyanin
MLDRMTKHLFAALCAGAILLAACGGSAAAPGVDASKGEIRADLKEYGIALTSTTMRSGTVTFVARNAGGAAHSFIVIKTDAAADKLPLDQQKQTAKEDGKVGGLDQIDPGKSQNLRLELPSGHYVIICNVPTHYQLGMRAELTVN